MDATTINANFEARAKAVSELRALADAASGREFTAEERQSVERLEGAIAEYDGRIQNGLRALEQERSMDEARSRFEAIRGTDTPEARQVQADADELRALAKGEKRAVEFRAMAKGGQPTGVVKPTLYESLYEEAKEFSVVMASGATILRTESGEDIVIPKAGAYSAATIVGEAGVIPASDPAFSAGVTIGAYKYAWLTDLSSELLADDAFDLVAYLARTGGLAMGDGIGRHLLTGTGTGQPNGVVTAATQTKTLATTTGITADNVIDIFHAIPRAYRGRAVWVIKDSTAAALRKVKNANDEFVWQESLRVDQPNLLLGRPVMTDDGMAEMAASARSVLFGDLRGYFARFAGPLRVERSTDFRFDTDQTTFRFIQRADGDLVDSKSVAVGVNAAV